MARKPKKYEDDDGRVIADMSGISRPGLILPGEPSSRPRPQQPQPQEETEENLRPWERAPTLVGVSTGRSVWGGLGAALGRAYRPLQKTPPAGPRLGPAHACFVQMD